MILRYDEHIEDFLKQTEEILLLEEAKNQLMLHNAWHLCGKPTSMDHVFGTVSTKDGRMVLAFLNMPPYNMTLANLGHAAKSEVVHLAEDLVNKNIHIQGVNAEEPFALWFASAYGNRKNVHASLKLSMEILELKKLSTVKLPDGIFRKASMEDLRTITDMTVSFALEALNEVVEFKDALLKNEERIRDGKFYIFEVDGNIVSLAMRSRQLKNGAAISMVYADSTKRNNGYGLAVTYHLCEKMLAEGLSFVTLFVDKRNPVSNRVYEKIGFIAVSGNNDYRFVGKEEKEK